MKLICAGNALKEVLSAGECRQALVAGAQRCEGAVSDSFVVSDGGDGFLDAYAAARALELEELPCTGPLGEHFIAQVGFSADNELAVIESARALGLALVPPERRNIMHSGSAGLGDLLFAASQKNVREIVVGLGGSATCDGGIGFLWKLAEHMHLCQFGCPEIRTAMDMADLPSPDIVAITEFFSDIKLTVCVDVDNPLLGETGAVHSFAAQKGADATQVEQLEFFMRAWAERIELNGNGNWRELDGAGAAGGLGFALAAIGAQLVSGAEMICDLSGLTDCLKPGITLVTAEGKFDSTSLAGKLPWWLANKARQQGAEAVIFAGEANAEAMHFAAEQGISVIEFGRGVPVEDRCEKSAGLLATAVADYFNGVISAKV